VAKCAHKGGVYPQEAADNDAYEQRNRGAMVCNELQRPHGGDEIRNECRSRDDQKRFSCSRTPIPETQQLEPTQVQEQGEVCQCGVRPNQHPAIANIPVNSLSRGFRP